MIGVAPVFRRAVELARQAAVTDDAILISGESGTGKEGLARLVHGASPRASNLLIPINCAGTPEALLEAEMFGRRAPGAAADGGDMPGLLETARGGTVFLDEVTEMPPGLQKKLLRVLQLNVVPREGSYTVSDSLDIRFISATECDPRDAVAKGALHEDLLHGLGVVHITLPPLRERPQDIPVLARHFLALYWKRHRAGEQTQPRLSRAALAFLCSRPWRGNVRELQNVMENVAALAEPGDEIGPEDMRLCGAAGGEVPHVLTPRILEGAYTQAKERVVTQFEREYLVRLVACAGGNMSRAARLAGIDRTTLYRLIERHSPNREEVLETVDGADTS